MPNPAGFGEHGFEKAVLKLEARLREELPCPVRKLTVDEIKTVYRQRNFARGWRLAMSCSDGVTRELDLLIAPSFPLGYPRTALVDGPGQLVWPHVEHDGILCLLPIMAEVDADDPGAVAINLISRSARLIEELLKGEIIEKDFREEFLTYWFYAHDAKVQITSLLNPVGPSREVRMWRDGDLTIVGETAAELEKWLSRRFGKPRGSKKYHTEPAAFLWLPEPLLPSQYPAMGRDLIAIAQDAADGAEGVLEKLATKTQKDVLVVMGAMGRGGTGLIAAMTTAGRRVGSRNGNVHDPISKGFAPKHMPPAVAALRTYSAAPVVKYEVSRADAAWVHGRGKDGRAITLLDKKVTIIGCGSVGSSVAARLVRAGVGHCNLVDPETLDWPNLGRHELGAASIGRNKALELAAQLQRAFPHLTIEGHEVSAQALVEGYGELLSSSDLVVAATGSWAAESALNRWHLTHGRRQPFLYGWTESYCVAGHSVLIGTEGGCLRCGIGGTGVPHLQACSWTDGKALLEEPSCGNHFTPYGAIELGYVVDLIAEAALAGLISAVPISRHAVWLSAAENIAQAGACLTEAMAQAAGDVQHQRIVRLNWDANECPACKFAHEYRSAA